MEKRHHIKDPGSAITHFIGMLMAIFAAVPLLIKAAHGISYSLCDQSDFIICCKYNVSYF